MDPYEFFPGDPPIADLLSPLGLGIAVAMAVISLLGFGLIRWGAVQGSGAMLRSDWSRKIGASCRNPENT